MDTAILNGVVSYLRNNLSTWNPSNCRAMPDGRPIPMMANEFCAVHITEAQGTTDDQGLLREVWGFGVTVTKRIQAVPFDRIVDNIYLEQISGLETLIRRIKFAITNRGEVVQAINAAIPTEENDPELYNFICDYRLLRPPIFINRNAKFRFRDEEWMHGSHSPTRDRLDGHVAISFTLNFGRLEFQISQSEDTCL